MTRIYFKATGSSSSASSYPHLHGTLETCDTPTTRRSEGWIRSGEVPGDETLRPFAANATVTERRQVHAQRTGNEFILQKDPDGRWYLDRWNDNAAGAPRPEPALARQTDEPRLKNASGACFIIEIG